MFAIYCGLALHHAKLYDKIRRSEQKYRVALEVLSYHNASSHNEVAQILEEGEPPKDEGISKYVLFYSIYKLVFFLRRRTLNDFIFTPYEQSTVSNFFL